MAANTNTSGEQPPGGSFAVNGKTRKIERELGKNGRRSRRRRAMVVNTRSLSV
jgi:hypothetical protein